MNSKPYFIICCVVVLSLMLTAPHVFAEPKQDGWYSIDGRPECSYWFPAYFGGKDGLSSTWIGTCKGGRIHDAGTLTISSKMEIFVVKGSFDNGTLRGDGHFTLPNGRIVEREVNDWEMVGSGKITYPDGYQYEGGIKGYSANGQGVLIKTDGTRWVGHFKDDLPNGEGVNITANGFRFEGNFEGSLLLSGQGRILRPNGDIYYEGTFEKGWTTGTGIKVFQDGSTFDGEIVKGVLSGNGVFVNSHGDRYEGNFVDDKLQGYGNIFFKNGSKYIGQVQDSLVTGQGIITLSNGYTCEGKYSEGLLIEAGKGNQNGKLTPCFTDKTNRIIFGTENDPHSAN